VLLHEVAHSAEVAVARSGVERRRAVCRPRQAGICAAWRFGPYQAPQALAEANKSRSSSPTGRYGNARAAHAVR
jgi:hypothetical protein